MSKLDSKERNALPKKDFAGPDRSYPVNDRSHAANAKSRASEMHNKGLLSLRAEELIDHKADQILKGK
jgi:hypothetical protein